MSDRLTTGQWMTTDAQLISANGLYAAYLQDDANLVLCFTTNGAADLSRPYWSVFANAAAQVGGPRTGPHYFAIMQSDGNFVLYNGSGPTSQGAPYWATGTNRAQGQFTVVMQDDGNFVGYDGTGQPIWASNTVWASEEVTHTDRLTTGQWMTTDAPLLSANASFAAYLQDDANLVLCFTTNGAADLSRPYWSVFANAAAQVGGPRTGPHYFAIMQSDGNFVLYNGPDPGSQGAPYWATGTNRAQGQFTMVMQNDGNFVIYDGTMQPIWASSTVQPVPVATALPTAPPPTPAPVATASPTPPPPTPAPVPSSTASAGATLNMNGWDVLYAVDVAQLNKVLAASASQLLSQFQYVDASTGAAMHGTFGSWSICPGGTASRIDLTVPLATGTFISGSRQVQLDGLEPVLNVALTLVDQPSSTAADLVFAFTRATSTPASAQDGDVYLANPDSSGLLAQRDPSGAVAAFLSDALPQFFVTNAGKISFALASVSLNPANQPWLRPTATAASYFATKDGSMQAIAIKTITQSAWGPSGLAATVDPGLLATGDSMFFSLSPSVLLRDLLMPALPAAWGNGVTAADFTFTAPPGSGSEAQCSITNTQSFSGPPVTCAGIRYNPQIDQLKISVSGTQMTTTAAGHFDITGLSGAWVSFDNLQVVNEIYYDSTSQRVGFNLVSQTQPSVQKHIPWMYAMMAVDGLIGTIILSITSAIVADMKSAVQDALSSAGQLPAAAVAWTGLSSFGISQAGLEPALVIRGNSGGGG